MARKLKVYAAEIDGLHEWIVAAPNQGEALAAFGINQDLFKQGLAHIIGDAKAAAAAQAEPGRPLRRLKGSKDPFKPADAEGSEAWSRAARAVGAKARPKPPRVKRDRSALDKAEADLNAFEAASHRDLQALEDEAKAVEQRRERLLQDQKERRRELSHKLDIARQGFERQG